MKKDRISHAQTRSANRNQLLNAARQVFATVGYDASTARDIVRESGLAQGSFYNNFKDKQEIFELVLADIIEPLIHILKQSRASAKTPHEFLTNAYEACRLLPEQNSETAAIIAHNQAIFRDRFYYAGSQAQIRADLVSDLVSWHDRKIFRHADFDLIAESMISLGIDLVIQSAQDPKSGKQRVAFLTSLFMPMLVDQDWQIIA